MPAERFFINADLQGELELEGKEFHHLTHVMRIVAGEEIELVNGRGSLASAEVKKISKHSAVLEVKSCETSPILAPHLTLAIPLMRPAKLELVIEKCTELGTDRFFLYSAQFSEKDDLSEHQLERLEHIAISAMKQCGRLDLPPIQLLKFDALFKESAPLYFGDTRGKPFAEKIKGPLLFVTGPEKGFSRRELELLDLKGKGVRLHKNILRAETAPLVASVLANTPSEWGIELRNK